MKKKGDFAKKRILPLLVFIFAQAKSWALETTSSVTINKSTSIFTQPWIWIAIIVTIIIVLIGPLDHEREYPVIMKFAPARKTVPGQKEKAGYSNKILLKLLFFPLVQMIHVVEEIYGETTIAPFKFI